MKEEDTGKEICSFLEKKVTLFSRYLSLTERMNAVLGEEDKDLKDLISKRQGCMEKIDKIDLSIQQAVGAGPDKHNLIPPKFKGLIDGYLKKLKSIMETVELLDREVTAVVKQEVENIKTDLLNMRNVRQAARGYGGRVGHPARGYGGSVGHPARFLDTRR
ncbi:MAG: hypothetical protein ISR63_04635 [Desulfobacterales bacterium]|nr:hypothetical protein [Desulfobacterales bacterium]